MRQIANAVEVKVSDADFKHWVGMISDGWFYERWDAFTAVRKWFYGRLTFMEPTKIV